MINSTGLVAVLDANVLYPAPLRDILLSLADIKLYRPKWTNQIQEEWMRNLLINKPEIPLKRLKSLQAAMDSAFPDARISAYQQLINSIELPDPDDRHVLAAAIKGDAKLIITNNLKDFPSKRLQPYQLEAQTPDKFIKSLISLDETRVLKAFHAQVNRLMSPPQSAEQVLATLERCGLTVSVNILRSLLKR
ncbi:PIN domain-containing protein [Chitinophaga sp. ARDCPP14]|uniref:PIN domain-containing protein n=1 Tax=Chitinophaga sp. ARDCPP14 TaxID=3391139 RepID=UPI003F523108